MIRVKITLDSVTKDLDPMAYQERWEEYCDESGEMEEGDEYPPITEEFVVTCFDEDVSEGNEDLAMLFETAEVSVEKA